MRFNFAASFLTTAFLLAALFFESVSPLGCYRCTSINGTNPSCEDTFMGSDLYFQDECQNRRHRRTGAFPSQYCIKFEAEDADENYTVMVRDCAVDDGGVNVDTEIGRLSHCGWMQYVYYNGRYMRGCISACRSDGCNDGWSRYSSPMATPLALLMSWFSVVFYHLFH